MDDDQPGVATGPDGVPARRGRGRHARRQGRPLWQEVLALSVVAVVVALLVKTFLVQLFYIPSGSMENTLRVGDRVAVNKLVYRFGEIRRGDVVVFDGADTFTPETTVSEPSNPVSRVLRAIGSVIGVVPPDEQDFIKRVIGVGGDRVVCCDEDGRLTVNGVALDEESYLYPGNVPSRDRFDVTVPEGRLWVMGDHRAASSDSRSHLGGPGGGTVAEDRVVGKAVAVVWPLGNLRRLGRPDTFDGGLSGSAAAVVIGPVTAAAAVAAVRWPLVPVRRRRRGRTEEEPA